MTHVANESLNCDVSSGSQQPDLAVMELINAEYETPAAAKHTHTEQNTQNTHVHSRVSLRAWSKVKGYNSRASGPFQTALSLMAESSYATFAHKDLPSAGVTKKRTDRVRSNRVSQCSQT